jgi:hypothetical protein
MERAPATELELRTAYGSTRLHAQGISFDRAIASPELRALLSLLVSRDRRHAQRPSPRPAFVSRIERTAGSEQPDLFSDMEPTP